MKKNFTFYKATKRKKIIFTIVSVIILLLVAFPFLINLYLRNKLPDLINEKTPYQVNMKEFNFDLISGNLHIIDVDIKNKNPKDTAVTQIAGKISELEVKDFGVFKALFSKKYKATIINIKNPNLIIQFAKKNKKDGNDKKKPNIFLNELKVANGELKAIDHEGKSVFNGNKINIDLQDIDLNNDDDTKLPIGFKKISLQAENLVISVNDYYKILADKINTDNKTIDIENFHLQPTQQPVAYNAKSIFDFTSKRIIASKFSIDRDSLIADKTQFDDPNLIITSTNKKVVKKNEKDMNLKIALNNIQLNNGSFLAQNINKVKNASAEKLNVNLTKIIFDKNTVKEKIPFKFDKHNINIANIYFRGDNLQEVSIGRVFTNDDNVVIDSVKLATAGKNNSKDLWSGQVKKITLNKIKSQLDGQKIKLNLSHIIVDNANVNMMAHSGKTNKPIHKAESDFDIAVGNVTVNNSQFEQSTNGQKKVSVANVNATFNGLNFNKTTEKNKIPFTIKNHDIKASNFFLDAGKYYTLTIKNLHNNGKVSTISGLAFKGKYSRQQFSKVIAKQEDLYDVTAKNIQVYDRISLFEDHEQIHLDKVILDGVQCGIYHDLAPPEDKSARSMFNEKLRNIKIPLFVNTVDLKNSYVSYEEDASTNNKPGKLYLDRFNATIKNVGNGKIKGLSSVVNVDSNFNFFGTAPTHVVWTFDVLNKMDEFKINGDISKLSADEVNLFVRPYLNITLDGKINRLKFDYYGNKNVIKGNFYLNFNDVYVNLLNKKGDKRKFLNKAVNLLVRSDSKDGGKTVTIEKERDADRSFFNMLWKGIMEGLKKTLL